MSKLNKITFVVVFISLTSCSSDTDNSSNTHKAEYIINGGEHSLRLELTPTHLYLAEYSRELILLKGDKVVKRIKLSSDSGGYADANLYRCTQNKYLVKGYFDSWLIDIESASITEGECKKNEHFYLGVFRRSQNNPWKFYSRRQSPEVKLIPKGG